MVAIIIIVAIVLAFISIVLLVNLKNKKQLCNLFSNGNVIVFGKKRKGKDILFNAVINARKKRCYSNISFNKKYSSVKDISDFELKGIDYKAFINKGTLERINRSDLNFEDGYDLYISDAGIHLPCQYNSELDKRYRSFPILYALSSQVFKMNIHLNTQALNRPWDKIREQADYYIKALHTTFIFGLVITRYRVYDKYASALNDLRVFKTSGGILKKSNDSKAQKDTYLAMNGVIEEHFIIQFKKHIDYDTNAFRCKLINETEEDYIKFKKL